MDEPPVSSATLDDADYHAPHTTRAAEGLPRRRFTVAEVEAMIETGLMLEDERVELIGGELVPMSSKGSRHETLKGLLLERWYRRTSDTCMLLPETTFRLSEDTFLEPDVVIFDRTQGLKGLTGSSVYLVVEIADSSLRYDIGRKAAIYSSFGIRDLWVIDAVKMRTHVFREPGQSGYAKTFEVLAKDHVTPLFAPDAFTLKLGELDL